MNKRTLLVMALAIGGLGSGLGLAQVSNDTPRVRLVLASGDTMDVRGPVTRHDGLVVFFTEEGMRTSIQERLVRRVQELATDGDDRPDGAARRSSPAKRPRGQFTNRDLPVSASPSDPAEEDPAAQPVPLRPRAIDPEAFGNKDLPISAADPTDEPQAADAIVPAPAPAGALTNEDLPRPAETAPDAPALRPAPPTPGAFTNENLPASAESPSVDATPQPAGSGSAAPSPGALTNADLPAQPTVAPEQPTAAVPTPPGAGEEDDSSAAQAEASTKQTDSEGNGND